MWQKQHQGRVLPPFCSRRGDELVNDDLGRVGEIAKLGLPQDKCLRSMNAVAILKAEYTCFRKRAVENGKRGTRFRKMLERNIGFPRMLVVKHSMAMAESSTFSVLTREADGSAFSKNGGKSKGFGLSPVDASFRSKRASMTLQQTCQLGIGREAFRPGQQFIIERNKL